MHASDAVQLQSKSYILHHAWKKRKLYSSHTVKLLFTVFSGKLYIWLEKRNININCYLKV